MNPGAGAGPGPAPAGAPVDGQGTDRARCVLAPNPSPMTLDGTNTWLLGEPDGDAVAVVDPGPHGDGHLRRVLASVEASGRRVAVVLLTHGHPDHAEGAPRFAELAGVPVRALDPAHRLGEEGLGTGDVVRVGGLEVRVLATPGHTSDSLCFHLPADGAILTGDTVLGRGTTVVAYPDGDLGAYLGSLHRLRDEIAASGIGVLLPGHGPLLPDPAAAVEGYLAHREERLEQVRRAVAAGRTTAADVVAAVYADVDPAVRFAAEMSVRAQLAYLRDRPV